jgi:hypothetical protein
MICTTYKGKHKRLFSVKTNKQSVTTIVYLSDKTIVTTVDKDGNVETSVEPIISLLEALIWRLKPLAFLNLCY